MQDKKKEYSRKIDTMRLDRKLSSVVSKLYRNNIAINDQRVFSRNDCWTSDTTRPLVVLTTTSERLSYEGPYHNNVDRGVQKKRTSQVNTLY